ncbi:MAG TPA: hypothetical protein DDY14_17575 [Chromatiaceae bacterium]|jgi:glycosyltransferase involved in cell wall biosynthesis|nr:MAG: hypothetical protein N838_05605 [Thiohalocapsa sp. PB-PSB1]HBG97090.1 hypothetical protein [Chromatiaceae bacterium]HCS89824.1 hypothetical protein [Chromatiaceae bacterium]
MALRVLFVAGEFPPIKTIGRLRSAKFVDYLRKDGFDMTVLTTEANASVSGFDPALLDEVPSAIELLRVPMLDTEAVLLDPLKQMVRHLGRAPDKPSQAPSTPPASTSSAANNRLNLKQHSIDAFKWIVRNWIEVPDSYWLWAARAEAVADQYCNNTKVDLVFTSLPPFSAARIGFRLKRKHGIPWVIDYRDLWYGDVLREWISPIRRRLELIRERRYLRYADAVVAVSEQKTAFLQTLQPKSSARFLTLTNGYDPEIYAPYLAEPRAPNATIDFVFTGRLFKNRRGYSFAEALGQLVAQQPALRARVKVHILGGVSAEIRQRYDEILAQYHIQDLYRFTGDLPYQEAMRAQVQADYLLLIVDTGTTSSGVIPGKLFEYVAARRPIFALTDPGATQQIIERGKIGTVVPAESVAHCREKLAQWLQRPVPEQLTGDWAYLAQFERRNISKRLASLLLDVANNSDSPTPAHSTN